MTAPRSPEPTTEAGRRLLADVREVIVHGVTDRWSPGFDLAWHVSDGIHAIESEAARSAAADAGRLREALEMAAATEEYRKADSSLAKHYREVLAATLRYPSDHGLDVERLARAIHLSHAASMDEVCGYPDRPDAIAIAAEYARLAPSVPPEET